MATLLDFLPSPKYAPRTAFVEHSLYRDRKFSYAEILDGTGRVESSLTQLGIQAGDRVILWGENSARWAMTFYACVRQKILVVPIDAAFSQSFVEKIQRATDARLICSDDDSAKWDALFTAAINRAPTKPAAGDDLLEVIYTSGTTGEPKGVMITHANLLANLVPIYQEYQKYKRYTVLISQIGFMHLIPLSHLFGQIMGLFIPQMLGGKVVFGDPAPGTLIPAIRKNRVSVLISVPKQISVVRKHVEARYETSAPLREFRKGASGVLQKWWHYRSTHRAFGWKFWAFISGGAALPLVEEDFWNRLGFAVIQGYGLTETAPSVTIAHPFKGIKRGSVGQVLPGLEVKISNEGEILVRGPNVSPGYYGNQDANDVFRDGWLHTGDLGSFDENRNLHILGRKKEVIVTPEGLNVYPKDLENILDADSRVLESAIVAQQTQAGSQVHAVLVLRNETDAADILAKANEKLEGFQRIRSYTIWPDGALPRTTTGKLKRAEIAASLERGVSSTRQNSESFAERIARGAGTGNQRLDEDLGLTSLDRLDLLVELEQKSGKQIDDAAFANAKTVSDVRQLLQQPVALVERHYPNWNWHTWFFVRWFRSLIWYVLVFPLMPIRIRLNASGHENVEHLPGPLLFVSNHQSILDAAIILRALPFRLRHSLAIAMGADRAKIDLLAASLFFNTYPLPKSSIGLKEALKHTGDLVDRGYSILIFPEGVRTETGKLLPFRNGAGVMAHELKIPVVPILLKGVFEIWPSFARGPRRKGVVQLSFGVPFELSGKTPAEITLVMENWFRENYLK